MKRASTLSKAMGDEVQRTQSDITSVNLDAFYFYYHYHIISTGQTCYMASDNSKDMMALISERTVQLIERTIDVVIRK
jgi:hypothetical protein